jgi:hypothetical protein
MLDRLLNEFKKDIKETITESVKLQLKELKDTFHQKESTVLLTRKETAKMLKIDLSTLFLWTKRGQIISWGIGHRVYYKISDIEDALFKLNN